MQLLLGSGNVYCAALSTCCDQEQSLSCFSCSCSSYLHILAMKSVCVFVSVHLDLKVCTCLDTGPYLCKADKLSICVQNSVTVYCTVVMLLCSTVCEETQTHRD